MKSFFCTLLFFLLFWNLARAQDLQWVNGLVGATFSNMMEMTTDADGNVILFGNFEGIANFDPKGSGMELDSGISEDFFLAKYENNGKLIWIKQFIAEGNAYEKNKATGLMIDPNGYILISGAFANSLELDNENLQNATGNLNAFIAQFDTDGNLNWQHALKSDDKVEPFELGLDQQNNIILTGYFTGTTDFDPSENIASLSVEGDPFNRDAFILKLDNLGNFLWVKKIGSTANDEANSLTITSENDIVLTGYFSGMVDFDTDENEESFLMSTGNVDIFLAKYDSDGNYIFAKRYGSATTLTVAEQGYAVVTDDDNSIYFAGVFREELILDESSSDGTLIGNGNSDAFLAKLNQDGDFLWANCICGPEYEAAYDLSLGLQNDIYLIGHFGGILDFDPGDGTQLRSSNGGIDVFTTSYNRNDGSLTWAHTIGGDSSFGDSGRSVTVDNNGALYLAGSFYGELDFADETLNANNNRGIFFTRFATGVAAAEPTLDKETLLYPNPFQDQIHINVDEQTHLRMIDGVGRLVLEQTVSKGSYSLQYSGAPGIYYVELISKNSANSLPILKLE